MEKKLRFHKNHFKFFILDKSRRKITQSHKSDVCNIDVRGASLAKNLKTEKHLDHQKINLFNFLNESNESNITEQKNITSSCWSIDI